MEGFSGKIVRTNSTTSHLGKIKDFSEIPGEPSRSEGAGECAIRIIRQYREALQAIRNELGVPGPGYIAPVANASEIAFNTLAGLTPETPDKKG